MVITDILSKFNIPFTEHHPKVTKDCVGIDCPFCGHKNFYCGIFRTTGNFSCWSCGAKGSLYQLLKKLRGITWEEYERLTGKSYVGSSPKDILDKIYKGKETMIEEVISNVNFDDPRLKKATGSLPEVQGSLLRIFQQMRGISSSDLDYYGAKIGIAGEFINRLVVPYPPPFMNQGKTLGLISRDLTGRASRKYLFTTGFNVHNYVYPNLAESKGSALILVEGIFDVWVSRRYMTYGLFGKLLHSAQLNYIIKQLDNFNTVVIALDGDAKLAINRMKDQINPFVERVIPLYLEYGQDPSNLGDTTFNRIVRRAIDGTR